MRILNTLAWTPQNKIAWRGDGYNYSYSFTRIVPILSESDVVVGNLETPIAGEQLGYTNLSEETVFNTPIEFAKAIKEAGVDIVTLANNHCLDRGKEGLFNTVKNVRSVGLKTVGCYLTKEESDGMFVLDLDGCKLSLLSYTYGTNSQWRNNELKPEEAWCVDLFRKQDAYEPQNISRNELRLRKFVKSTLPHKIEMKLRNIVEIDGVKQANPLPEDERYIKRMNAKIIQARKEADLVIMCMHSGGQWNNNIGEYTKNLASHIMSLGCDVIVGNHPHVILGYELLSDERLVTYSLGNFCYTPEYADYVVDVQSEYSILLHLYVDTDSKKIIKRTATLLRVTGSKKQEVVIWPVYALLDAISDKRLRWRYTKEAIMAWKRFGLNVSAEDLFSKELDLK